jgi:hypothetical protein
MGYTATSGMPRGRPPALTDAITESICDFVSKGIPIKHAAATNGVSERSILDYTRKGNEDLEAGRDTVYSRFAIGREKAHAQFLSTQAMVVMKHAVGFATKDGGRREGDWRAGAWLLERRGGADWIPNVQIEHTGGVNVEHGGTVRHEIVELPSDRDRLREVAAVLQEIGVLPQAPQPQPGRNGPQNDPQAPHTTDDTIEGTATELPDRKPQNGSNGHKNGSNGFHPKPPGPNTDPM